MRCCPRLVASVRARMQKPASQRRLVLLVVSIALLLDNMLYMVIVPIVPDYLRSLDVLSRREELINNSEVYRHKGDFQFSWLVPEAENAKIGFLFAFKAIVQLFFNPLSGYVIDRIGYDVPMVIGLSVIFVSTSIFAFGRSFGVMFTARGLQGAGSAFADTAGLAMVADRYTEESERSMALGISLAFISFGCLFAPPFGGVLYQYCGKEFPFLILAFLALFDGFLVMIIMQPVRLVRMELQAEGALPKPIPIHRLLLDPYILICAGALVAANISLAFLEPTIATWMQDTMKATNSQTGLIWLPAFVPHVLGVYTTVKLAQKHPQYQWLMAAIGLLLEGLSCLFIPLCTNFIGLMFPIGVLCYGAALVDTAILPCLGYLVDTRFVSIYGSVYAIADISYSLAYAFGPIVAGNLLNIMSFSGLNICTCVVTCAYVPFLYILRKARVSEEERKQKMGLDVEPDGEEDALEKEEAMEDLGELYLEAGRPRLKRQETARFEPAGCRRSLSKGGRSMSGQMRVSSTDCPGYEQQSDGGIMLEQSTAVNPTFVADGTRGVVPAKVESKMHVYEKDAGYGY